MSQDLIEKFRAITESMLSPEEQRVVGVGAREAQRSKLDEAVDVEVVRSYNRPDASRPLVPIQGKDSDGELVFEFEDRSDAVDLYSFFMETKLLEAGEVVLRNIEGQHSVAFMPHVMVTKPEMIQAAFLFYEDQLDVSEKDEEAFESVISGLTDLLTEAPVTKTAGAPKRKREMGNPFHDKDTGKFSGVHNQANKKGGSWAYKKTKLKFTGKGKTKEGGLLGKYGSTKHPCGRAARADGKDVRCWDGKTGAGARVRKVMSKKKRSNEELNIADLSLIMEMRAKYRIG